MSEYRRATAEELAEVGVVLNKDKYMKHTNFAKSYYPPEAYTMTLVVHSEYNDSTYDNGLQYVLVHDKDGNELPPLKKTARECREGWTNLKIPNTCVGHYDDPTHRRPITVGGLRLFSKKHNKLCKEQQAASSRLGDFFQVDFEILEWDYIPSKDYKDQFVGQPREEVEVYLKQHNNIIEELWVKLVVIKK